MKLTFPLRALFLLVLCASMIACGGKKADETAADGTATETADSLQAEMVSDADGTELNDDQPATDVSGQKGIVSTKENSDLRIRSSPDVTSGVLGKIPNKATVDIVGQDEKVTTLDGETGRWLKVKYNNIEGWVWGNFIVIE